MRLLLWMAGLSVCLGLPLAGARAEGDERASEARAWATADLSSAWVRQFINNGACATSDAYQASCQAALQAAADLLEVQISQPGGSEFEADLDRLTAHASAEIPKQFILATALRAHLRYFDPYADIFPTSRLSADNGEDYVGVGLLLEPGADGLTINEVFPDSPAGRAGLQEGDTITQIVDRNGRTLLTTDLDFKSVGRLIRDRKGSLLTVQVARRGLAAHLPFQLRREPVAVANVESKMLDKRTGYLRIRGFNGFRVCREVSRELAALADQGAQALVLDLRANPGGEKAMAVCVAQRFLGRRRLLGTQYVQTTIPALLSVLEENEFVAATNQPEWEDGLIEAQVDWPIAVLVDGGTASAAEILAGTLQDNHRAVLVGQRTYGKGVAQQWRTLPSNPSLTMVWTSERFYFPSGRTNQGLEPDYPITGWGSQRAYALNLLTGT